MFYEPTMNFLFNSRSSLGYFSDDQQNSSSSSSSSSLQSLISTEDINYSVHFESPFLYSNPNLIYSRNSRFLDKFTITPDVFNLHFQTNYVIPQKQTSCNLTHFYLPEISDLLNKSCTVDIFDCRSHLKSEFDEYLVNMLYRTEDYEVNFDTLNFDLYDDLVIKDEPYLVTDFPYYFNDKPLAHKIIQNPYLSPFTCTHSVLPTSLIKGIGAGIYSAYQFVSIRNDEETIMKAITHWSLELLQLATNFSISSLIITFLKVVNQYFNVQFLAEKALHFFKVAYDYLLQSMPTQPSEGISVVETSLLLDGLKSLSTVKNSPLALASAMSSIVLVFAAIIIGKDFKRFDQMNLKAIANTFANISKLKTGISATKEMFINFHHVLYDAIFDLLGLESESHLLYLIRQTSTIESNENQKDQVFEYAKFLIDPNNHLQIQSNSALRRRLEFTYSVISEVQFKLANDISKIPQQTIGYINNICNELHKVRKTVSKVTTGHKSRFTPMWINFVGESHTGKSSFTSIFTSAFAKLLRLAEPLLDVQFDIPCDDNVEYHVNFSDKFLTNYTSQYMCVIDDFAQDKSGTLETASSLNLINWVSNIPHYTNQAHLDNKGIAFESKLIVSTSNDFSLAGRTEIISIDALINRMTMCFTFHKSTEEDVKTHPWFPCKVRIDYVDFKTKKIHKRNITPEEVIQLAFERFYEWYKKERLVETFRTFTDDEVIDIMRDIPIIKQAVARIVTTDTENVVTPPPVEATSRFKCVLQLHPGHKDILRNGRSVKIFDCHCHFHNDWNTKYFNYITGNYAFNISIDQFVENYNQNQTTLEYLSSILNSSWNTVKQLADKYLNNIWFKMIVGAVSMALATSYFWDKLASNEEESSVVSTAKYSTQLRRVKPTKTVIATSGLDNIENMFSDSLCKNAMNIAQECIIKRGHICKLESEGSGARVNVGLRIQGSTILSNHHFFNTIEENSNLKISYNDFRGEQKVVNQIFVKEKMYRIPDTDLALYKCDSKLPGCRDLIKHFPENTIMPQHQKSIVITASPVPIVYTNVIAKPTIHRAPYEVEGVTYSTLDNYETNCPVEFGMSGSVLFSLSNSNKHKIIGIQTCMNNNGLNSHGYFKPVSQCQLKTGLSKLGSIEAYADVDKLIEATSLVIDNRKPPNFTHNGLTYLGTIPKTKQLRQQNVSKIIESLIHDPYNRTQEPSVLNDHDNRMKEDLIGKSVIFRAIEGFDNPIGNVNTVILQRAANQLQVEYDVMLAQNGIHRRVLTNFEMINGIPQVMLGIDMKTSPGYPYTLERKNTTIGGKFEFFEETEPPEGYGKTYQMKSYLSRGLEQAEQELRNGKLPLFIAYACLKDETRPIEKITNGKTRAFICLPLHYNLLIRKYFGAFTSTQKSKAGIISSTVGVDPAKDWRQLYDKLMQKNYLWEDFDYANWDQHLHPELILKIADVINYWYNDGEVNARVRYLLLYNLVHTFVIVKDRIFIKQQGQCSGCAITAELNCLVHDLLMVYVWIKYHEDQGLETSISEMRENVALCVYGDDIIMSTKSEYRLPFNGKIISPYMDELGMNITPGDKKSTEFILKPPEEIFFLKRNFVRDGDNILAPLRSDIVENIIQWIHKSDDNLEATRVNCVTALQESYMHREPYFNKLSNIINERIKLVNLNTPGLNFDPIVLDYRALERRYIGGYFICAGLSESMAIRE